MTAISSSAGRAIRALLRATRSGALATAMSDGSPYASLATVAWDADGSPLFLFSDLADHSRNLKADRRASLLVERTSRRDNPQSGPRATLVGEVIPSDKSRHRRRYLALHPGAEPYAGFADFRVYRMALRRVHFVGGFARAQWLEAGRVLLASDAVRALADAEPEILAHMNRDHVETIDLYAAQLLGRRGHGWQLAGIDPDGVDLRRRGTFARLSFAAPVTSPEDCRRELVRLAGAARAARRSP